MYKPYLLAIIALQTIEIQSFIVPDEIPTILSLVYSVIPPIKKGTDSRIGAGFRLGRHADFQVILELGPQTNTRPLGVQPASNSKRNVRNNAFEDLYAQRPQEKLKQISDTDGGKWLESWSQQMYKLQAPSAESQPVEGAGEIDASLIIPPDETIGASALKSEETSENNVTKGTVVNDESIIDHIANLTSTIAVKANATIKTKEIEENEINNNKTSEHV